MCFKCNRLTPIRFDYMAMRVLILFSCNEIDPVPHNGENHLGSQQNGKYPVILLKDKM